MTLHFFLIGMATSGFLVVSLFFLRFWKKTRDQLFAAFSFAFFLFACERLVVLFTLPNVNPYYYLLRFLAYIVIGISIARKNREA